jgi:hypothetical protein
VKRLVLIAVALSIAVAAPGAAHAATPCRDRLINDWLQDGKIKTTYPIACYHDALRFVNGKADLSVYSSLGDDIRTALLAAQRRARGQSAPAQAGKGFKNLKSLGKTSNVSVVDRPDPHDSSSNDDNSSTQTTATPPVASLGSSGGLPVPLLVLGGLAVLLIAAGAVGAGVRHFRN